MEIGLYLIYGLAFAAPFLFIYIAPAAWAVGDAQRRGQASGVVAVLFWFFGPFSALIWLAVRPKSKVVDRSPDDYTNPDDALSAAACLDQLGEWDAAIAIYENAVKRWPDQHDYIATCINRIKALNICN